MKFLPFERTYQLESLACSRCAGSGRFAAPATHGVPDCYNCRGLGRWFPRVARELFDEVCALLGRPVTERESRIAPKHLEAIVARQLRVGMCVAETRPDRRRPRQIITAIEPMPLEQIRITFADRYRVSLSPDALLSRELTPTELDEAEALLADRIDHGAALKPQRAVR